MLRVIKFTKGNFADALSSNITPVSVIRDKSHFKYLMHYLGASKGLNAQTMVIEENYISKDYLHDYADYYSLCFEQYQKVCKRIHLFDSQFTKAQFSRQLLVKDPDQVEDFWKHYLGYIVVKPIPVTVIGTTVLKTYPHEGRFGGRTYWGLKDFTVHVFGVKQVIKTLVFQEQDKVTAACATTAIWSTLSKVYNDFQASYKSPSQITKDADNVSQDGSRLFPNKGLSVLQICQAIERSGLVCEIKHDGKDSNNAALTSNAYLKELVRAYAGIGVPIIVIIEVPLKQHHAITLVGHRHQGPSKQCKSGPIQFMSENIDRLYAHDDQWGPFARIRFGEGNSLITPWNELKSTSSIIHATDVVVSIFPKIRINYEDIKSLTLSLNGIFNELLQKKPNAGWEWDIQLQYSEIYKNEVRDLDLAQEKVLEILTQPMPRFIWVVSCLGGGQRLVDFTFDATGVITGMIGLRVLFFEGKLRGPLHTLLKNAPAISTDYFEIPSAPMYRDWLLKETEK